MTNPYEMVERTQVSALCPVCGEAVAATVLSYPNVKCARRDRPLDLDHNHDCFGMSRDSFVALDCLLWDAFEEVERTTEPARPFDRKEDRF